MLSDATLCGVRTTGIGGICAWVECTEQASPIHLTDNHHSPTSLTLMASTFYQKQNSDWNGGILIWSRSSSEIPTSVNTNRFWRALLIIGNLLQLYKNQGIVKETVVTYG